MCDKLEIEDEIHFVVQCPRYQSLRDNFFMYICRNVSENFVNYDAVDKFIFLMKLNGKHIRNFAKYSRTSIIRPSWGSNNKVG